MTRADEATAPAANRSAWKARRREGEDKRDRLSDRDDLAPFDDISRPPSRSATTANIDSRRPVCANSGRSLAARRKDHVDPWQKFWFPNLTDLEQWLLSTRPPKPIRRRAKGRVRAGG
jgi:hypothetical protein